MLHVCPGRQLLDISRKRPLSVRFFLLMYSSSDNVFCMSRNKAHSEDSWLKVLSVPRVGWLAIYAASS